MKLFKTFIILENFNPTALILFHLKCHSDLWKHLNPKSVNDIMLDRLENVSRVDLIILL